MAEDILTIDETPGKEENITEDPPANETPKENEDETQGTTSENDGQGSGDSGSGDSEQGSETPGSTPDTENGEQGDEGSGSGEQGDGTSGSDTESGSGTGSTPDTDTDTDTESPITEKTNWKITSLFLKDKNDSGEEVEGIGAEIPLAVDFDNVIYSYSSQQEAGSVVTELKTLKDILFGLYNKDDEKNINYQYGYLMPFDVNETSFIQYLINTQKNWMDNFFGIYPPAENVVPKGTDPETYYAVNDLLGYYFDLEKVKEYCYIPVLGNDGVGTTYRKVTEAEAKEICNKITNRSLAQLLLTAENYWALLPTENYYQSTAGSIVDQDDIKKLFSDANGDYTWKDSNSLALPDSYNDNGGN